MPREIAPGVLVYSRDEWGANAALPRLGERLNDAEAVEAIEHHTVGIDNDNTPNLWEGYAECAVRMRRYQTIRPDLGLDVPYNWIKFLMHPSYRPARVLVFEGRGWHRRGAHTKYHNRTGRAVATAGNLQLSTNIGPYVDEISAIWGWGRSELPNLGTVTPERGGIVFGHTDFRDPNDTSTWTACPGRSMMNVIAQLQIGDPLMSVESEIRAAIREVENTVDDLAKAVAKQTAKGDTVDQFQTKLMAHNKAVGDFLTELAAYNYRVNILQQAWMQQIADQHALDDGASPADREAARTAVTNAAAELAKAIEEKPEPPDA